MTVTRVQCPNCQQWRTANGACGCPPIPGVEGTQLLSAMRLVARFMSYPMALKVQLLRWFEQQVGQETVCPLCAGKGYVKA